MRAAIIIAFTLLYGVSAFQNIRHPAILHKRQAMEPLFATVFQNQDTRPRKSYFDAQDFLQVIPLDLQAVPSLPMIQAFAKKALVSKSTAQPSVQRTGGYPSKAIKDSIYLHLWSHLSGKALAGSM
jgi:hypothetical protein